ncbi:MAG: flagellar protein FliT [Burkholderiaceae bacterium]|jgi:flagellar protein FliT|nr:flagellar protein FliT [Burkholderiaceae bacterium]
MNQANQGEMILSTYRRLSGIMGTMALAAGAGEWDRLEALEQQSAACMDVLRASDRNEILSDGERQEKMAMIRQILEDDRKIRDAAEPRLKQLSDLIASSRNARRVTQAYGVEVS